MQGDSVRKTKVKDIKEFLLKDLTRGFNFNDKTFNVETRRSFLGDFLRNYGTMCQQIESHSELDFMLEETIAYILDDLEFKKY